MTQATLIGTRIAAGIWEGVLSGQKDAPQLEVLHLEKHLGGVEVTEIAGQPGHWAVRIQIPSEVLSDGVQTFVIRDRLTGATLSHFTVIAGLKAEGDLRAEVDLLRAELDLMKRAFRRHCVETAV
jgi:hypothetical protein